MKAWLTGLWNQEPVRVALYGLGIVGLAALVTKGVIDSSAGDDLAGILALILGVGGAEVVRQKVRPVISDETD